MKKILVLAVTALGFTFNASAQNKVVGKTTAVATQKANPEALIENNAEAATQKLDKLVGGLTKEQTQLIKEANLNMERRKQIVMQMNDANKDKMLLEIESNRNRMYFEILKEKQAEKLQNSLKK